MRVLSSPNFRSLTDRKLEVKLLVWMAKSREQRAQPKRAPVLLVCCSESGCSLSVRKSSWDSLSWRKTGEIMLNAELKSTNRTNAGPGGD